MSYFTPNIELLYFTGKTCSVCTVLKPKVKLLIEQRFPQVKMLEVNVEDEKELAAKHSVFTLPVALIMVDGREKDRFVRSFSVHEIEQKIQRLLDIINA